MTFKFRVNMLAGLTAATLCLVLLSSNQAAAQVFLQRNTISHGYYNPYGAGFHTGYGTGFYGGQVYGRSLTTYGYGLPGMYASPPTAVPRYGVYYGGGLPPQIPTFGPTHFGNAPRHYGPYGYGWRW